MDGIDDTDGRSDRYSHSHVSVKTFNEDCNELNEHTLIKRVQMMQHFVASRCMHQLRRKIRHILTVATASNDGNSKKDVLLLDFFMCE